MSAQAAGHRPAAPVAPRRRPTSRRKALRALPLLPALVLLAGFFVGPIVWAFRTTTTNTSLTGPFALHPRNVGLANFRESFASAEVHGALVRTLVFVVACVAAQNILGLSIAGLMQGRSKAARSIVSGVVVGAWVIPEIVAAFIWYSYLQPQGGTLNDLTAHLGVPAQSWLVTSPLIAVVLANNWRGTAFSMLIYNAALQDVPRDTVEAASVDGANRFQRIAYVVFPTLRRTASANLMLTTLSTLGVFGLIWAMTAGGPVNRSETLPVLMYREAFTFGRLGYAASISLIILGIGAVFAAVYLVVLKGDRR